MDALKARRELVMRILTEYARVPYSHVLDAVLTYDDATVDKNARDASSGARRLRLLGIILPVAALLLGLVSVAAGLVLLRSPEGRRVARGERRPAGAV